MIAQGLLKTPAMKAVAVAARPSTRPGWSTRPTSATGTAWERTPWHATPRAAWEALTKDNDRISWAG
jgi:hypothetical protein